MDNIAFRDKHIKMMEEINQADNIAFDTESADLGSYPYRISIATADHSYSLAVGVENYKGYGYVLSVESFEWLKWVLATKRVIMHNAKYDMLVMKRHLDMDINIYEDTLVLAHLLDESRGRGIRSLKTLAVKHLKVKQWDISTDLKRNKKTTSKVEGIEDLPKSFSKARWTKKIKKIQEELAQYDMENLSTMSFLQERPELIQKIKEANRFTVLASMNREEYMLELEKIEVKKQKALSKMDASLEKDIVTYSRLDARHTFDLFSKMWEIAEEEKVTALYKEIERPLIKVVMKMQFNGVKINTAYLRDVEQKLTAKQAEVQAILREFFGGINLNSTKQLSSALFEQRTTTNDIGEIISLPPLCRPLEERSAKSGNFSTRGEILNDLAKTTPEVAEIVKLREVNKLLSTYMYKEDRLHAQFNQSGTVTGRFCFHHDTLIETKSGKKNISELNLDIDLVLTHEGNWKKVLRKIYKGKEQMYTVTNSLGQRIICTQKHRFLTPSGWQSLEYLTYKAALLVKEKSAYTYIEKEVNIISIERRPTIEDVFDIEVEDDHSFISQGFINHNSSSKPNLQNVPVRFDEYNIRKAFIPEEGHKFLISDYCLAEGTLVLTNKGNIPIEQIQVGDLVTQEDKSYRKVLSVPFRGKKSVMEIRTKSAVVLATMEHRFRVIDNMGIYVWRRVGEIKHSDYIAIYNSDNKPINLAEDLLEEIAPEILAYNLIYEKVLNIKEAYFACPTYDLEVEDTHSFIANGFVSHNSQVELRMTAYFSRDPEMLKCYREGVDIHSRTAIASFNLDCKVNEVKELYPKYRKLAKGINFGLIYGMSPFTLAKVVGMSLEEAKQAYKGYFLTYAGVKPFMNQVKDYVAQHGFIRTIRGRKRRLPDLMRLASKDKRTLSRDEFKTLAYQEREANNFIIQGSAGDLMKRAMVIMHKKLVSEGCKLVMTIHDEVVISCPEDKIDAMLIYVKQQMEQAIPYINDIVPIIADPIIADTWSEGK